jgi:cobalamin biosynthesis Co2+ chelatase CbiK
MTDLKHTKQRSLKMLNPKLELRIQTLLDIMEKEIIRGVNFNPQIVIAMGHLKQALINEQNEQYTMLNQLANEFDKL